MFGLEQKEKPEEETFDLEDEIKDPVKYRKLKEHVDTQIQKLKKHLRSGSENKEEFDQCGALLHAYAALQKLMVRLAERK